MRSKNWNGRLHGGVFLSNSGSRCPAGVLWGVAGLGSFFSIVDNRAIGRIGMCVMTCFAAE